MEKENNIQLNELLEQFKAEGINPKLNLEAFRSDYEDFKSKSIPIFIQILIFIGALLAAGFFLGFLAMARLFESELATILLGIIIIVGGVAIPYQTKREASVEPLGMAALIVGGSLFAAGFSFNGMQEYKSFLFISLALSLFIGVIAGSHLQKISSIIVANLCIFALIADVRFFIGFNFLVLLNAVIITALWLKESTVLAAYPPVGRWYPAIVNGCSVSMLGILALSVNERIFVSEWEEAHFSYWWLSSIMLVSMVLWALYETLDLVGEQKKKIPILIGAALALMILVKAPGIIGGILLLFLGVFAGYRLFAGQGILAIFFFTVMFYYNMNTTLLIKSSLMVTAGIIFLGIGYALKRMHDAESQA